jgi:hypothetical protein
MAVPMANDPPFATLNHFAADLGIPSESDLLRIGIKAEYLYVDLGNFNCGLNCGLVPGGNVSFTTNIFRGGANVRF